MEVPIYCSIGARNLGICRFGFSGSRRLSQAAVVLLMEFEEPPHALKDARKIWELAANALFHNT